MSSPWLMSSGWLAFFSLYVGVRSSQLTGVTVHSSQASSVCSGRWLWTNSVQRSGSRPRREERRGHLQRPLPQQDGIVAARQGVVVDDAVDRLVLPLERDVVPDRAEVVAEVDDAGRLDAAEDAGPLREAPGPAQATEGIGRSWWPSVPERPPASATIRADGPDPVTRSTLRVAVLGAGTVGREVVRAFETFPERLAVHGGPSLVLAGVGVRDLARARAAGIGPNS